jgi:tRNA G18 (ribose-2'-O)-methylase SpoU
VSQSVSAPATSAVVRCPSERCGALFAVGEERLGRNLFCPVCGARMTARPRESRERRAAQRAGALVARLPVAALVDNVRSLWNVGSIFRSADACGLRQLVLCGITGCPPRPEIAKTALGAEEAVAWRYRADPRAALAELAAEGYTPVVIETTPAARPIEDLDWPDRPCLVIGNEVAGVCPSILGACPRHAFIPMLGVKGSLNVAVAFGIAAYHVARVVAARNRAVP